MMNLPPQVNTALCMLARAGFEACVVGGAVRDFVRGEAPAKDWDIATNARPEQIMSVFSGLRLIETGLQHGTITVLMDQMPLEITTYRTEGAYSDHRHPDCVRFTQHLEQDLARRDFTMNALAYHPDAGLIDRFGGVSDLADGLIRCVGDPDRRFQEDALRILRALRFASTLDLRVEPATASAIHRNRLLLRAIAAERIQGELTQLLCGGAAGRVLSDFSDVIAAVIPELAPMFGFEQQNPHHDRDVWAHTLAVVSAAPPQAALRWAALLHDVAKPHCFSLDDSGIGYFYGHAELGAAMADTILLRLRFDTASRTRITTLIRCHCQPIAADLRPLKRMVNRLGVDAARQLICLQRADACGQPAACAPRLAVCDLAAQALETLVRQQSCFCLKDLAVNGNDMLAIGLRGEAVGRALHACLDAVLDDRLPNDRAQLLVFARSRKNSAGE